tara:strand:+ start:55 stop:354 length:300 start_codon:yes stop_codon:yes gene_type:complete
MAKKTVSINSTATATGTTYYTCPANTVAKVISMLMENAGRLRIIAANYGTVTTFQSYDVNGVDTQRKNFYLDAGQAIEGHNNTSGDWTVILVEESLGVQ